MEHLPTIDIITPIRNRAWILPYFLKKIYDIDYPKNQITLIFCLNDSKDESQNILNKFKDDYNKQYKDIQILIKNLNAIEDKRESAIRAEIYTTLSQIRNFLLKQTKSDYVFSIDSDILCEPDILKRLLSAKKDMISSLIYNGYLFEPERPWKYTNIMNKLDGKQYIHLSKRHRDKDKYEDCIVKADMTGAVSLFTKDVAKSCTYQEHPLGEDFPFCEQAIAKGFKLYSNINLYSQHIMSEELLQLYLDGKIINGVIIKDNKY